MKKNQIEPKQSKTNFFSVNLRRISFLLLGIFFMIGCSNEKEDSNNLNGSINTKNKVPVETINLIAKNFFKTSSLTGKGKQNKTIKSSKEFKTSKKASAFYVVNYNEGGFLILAADDRVSPILAYSDSGDFKTQDNEIIPPVAYWIESQKNQVQSLINNNQTQSKELKKEWDVLKSNEVVQKTSTTSRIEPTDPKDCPDVTVIKGPLLTTVWGQGDGYNNLLTLNCSYNYYLGYKAPTGCVATSMAQIMRYFQKPNTYVWSNMPNNGQYSNGTYDIQLLMKNAGISVNMQYGCSSSGAVTANAAAALKNTFGYSAATFGGFNLSVVVQNLNYNKPVILTGGTNSGGNYVNGHAWVCDGYMQSTFYYKDDYGNCTGGGVTYYPILHMNWGWDGQYNGYYSVSNFNPGSNTFNYQNQMLYNINI